jgi:hypothetical protein
MKEAGAPSTVGVVTVLRRCARHPGGSHGRITNDPMQHGEGAKSIGRATQNVPLARPTLQHRFEPDDQP